MLRPLADEPERRRIPERRRPAVAEQYLVAVRQLEQLGQPGADARDEERTGACRWLVPRIVVPVAASASTAAAGTLDGPEPNRPSRGRSSAGMLTLTAASSHRTREPGPVCTSLRSALWLRLSLRVARQRHWRPQGGG